MNRLLRSLAALVTIGCAVPVFAEDRITLDGLDVAFWPPEAARYAGADKPPVVVFSHGYTGCAQQSAFLMEALARAGYAVFAVNHDDARCGQPAKPSKHPTRSPQSEEAVQSWSDASFENRRDDLADLVAAIEASEEYQAAYDTGKIALIGHSLGGMSVLAAAGGREEWDLGDKRIKAVVALSPFVQPLIENGNLDEIDVPVMYQGGTDDPRFTPAIDKKGGAYDETPEPKYFIEFEGANHASWTQLSPDFQPDIARYAVAFLDRYVKGDQDADRILQEQGNKVAILRYATPEGSRDEGERSSGVQAAKGAPQPNPNAGNEKGTVRERFQQKTNPFSGPLGGGILSNRPN